MIGSSDSAELDMDDPLFLSFYSIESIKSGDEEQNVCKEVLFTNVT